MAHAFSDISTIVTAAQKRHLALMGVVQVDVDDPVPPGSKAIILLGPYEPGFWDYFRASPEYQDGLENPLDAWSVRTINALAHKVGGQPMFPFGEPALPFLGWALRSGRAWTSPVAMLVQDRAGLFVSFRGAVALPWAVEDPTVTQNPCKSCAAPCADACPVDALHPDGYDVNACHAYLDTPAGQDCMTNGCAARRICPVSQSSSRIPAQSAFHMKAFHK